jgi:hypothetical protein
MNTISESTLSVAICDQFAFYPFRALVAGGLSSWEETDEAEQFIRTVLLHDFVELDGEPMPSPDEEEEWTEEQIAVGAPALDFHLVCPSGDDNHRERRLTQLDVFREFPPIVRSQMNIGNDRVRRVIG